MNGFGVALRFADLRHLLLQDSVHIKVMERVAKFLRRHSVDGMDVFSTRSEQNWDSATFLLGANYAKMHLNEIWQKESKDAWHRTHGHMIEQVRKLKLAHKLRIELERLNQEDEKACTQSDEFALMYEYHDPRATAARRAVNRIQALINSKQKEIKEAEKAPPPVVQPLPDDADKAFKVLFFLYMSTEFQHLSRLSFTAQQLLVPRPWTTCCGGPLGVDKVDVFNTVSGKQENIEWKVHYDEHQNCIYHTPSESRQGRSQCVDISMHVRAPDEKNRAEGICWSDESNIRMVWCGGCHSWDTHESGKEFNPFLVASQYTGISL